MNSSDYSRIRKLPVNFVSEPSVEFIRKYNTTFDNIKYCGLCSTGTSRIAKAKNNTHGQVNIMMTNDLHVPVTSAALYIVQYIMLVLCMNITKKPQ